MVFHSVLQFWPGSAEAASADTTEVTMSAAPIPAAAMTFRIGAPASNVVMLISFDLEFERHDPTLLLIDFGAVGKHPFADATSDFPPGRQRKPTFATSPSAERLTRV